MHSKQPTEPVTIDTADVVPGFKIPAPRHPTARDAYAARKAEIEKLMAELSAALVAHEPKNPDWGHVGDLGTVGTSVQHAVRFLTGAEG